MKISKNLIITLLFYFFGIIHVHSPPGPPGGGMGGPPCWPPSDCDPTGVLINNELIFLLIGGLFLGYYYLRKPIPKNIVSIVK